MVIALGGYDEVRFTAPFRAGDVVALLIETVETRAPKSKQDRGIVTLRLSLLNQTNNVCMRHLDTMFVLRRGVIASYIANSLPVISSSDLDRSGVGNLRSF